MRCVLAVKKQRRLLICDIQQLQTALQCNSLTETRHNTVYLPDLTCPARLLCIYYMRLLLAALPSPDVTTAEGVALAWYAHAPTHAHARARAHASRTRSTQHFLGLARRLNVVAPLTCCAGRRGCSGPERGWTDAEVALLHGAGFGAAHLGPQIFRTEMAVALSSAVVAGRCGWLSEGFDSNRRRQQQRPQQQQPPPLAREPNRKN
eukprot:COSAG06_NODE_3332_length_5493_cov_26.676122_4_plen_206_part_00